MLRLASGEVGEQALRRDGSGGCSGSRAGAADGLAAGAATSPDARMEGPATIEEIARRRPGCRAPDRLRVREAGRSPGHAGPTPEANSNAMSAGRGVASQRHASARCPRDAEVQRRSA